MTVFFHYFTLSNIGPRGCRGNYIPGDIDPGDIDSGVQRLRSPKVPGTLSPEFKDPEDINSGVLRYRGHWPRSPKRFHFFDIFKMN